MSFPLLPWLVVALGGGVGALFRYWINLSVTARLGARFPFGTLSVNALGAFLIGLLAGLLPPLETLTVSQELLWLLFGIGFCGSLTTFSSWSLDSLRLALERRYLALAANLLLTLILGMALVLLGYLGGSRLA